MPTDPRIDAYIAARADFARPILTHLRDRIHALCPMVEETIRWSMPFFLYKGRLLANMAAFKQHVSFGFWEREALATGHEGEAQGDEARGDDGGRFGRMTSLDDLPDDAVLAAKLREAAERIDSGERPRRAPRPPRPAAEMPAELAEALAHDEAAAATFNAFPRGQRREYCEWIGEAKRSETRAKRVAEAIGWLREGKRRNWKYEKG